MDAYADLWKVVIGYGRNWFIEGKPADAAWATEFLTVLNACNAQHGVFFSEDVYRPFFEYRERLILIFAKAKEGLAIGPDDIAALTQLSTHGAPGMKSLAGAMKDDLGSYVRVAIQGS